MTRPIPEQPFFCDVCGGLAAREESHVVWWVKGYLSEGWVTVHNTDECCGRLEATVEAHVPRERDWHFSDSPCNWSPERWPIMVAQYPPATRMAAASLARILFYMAPLKTLERVQRWSWRGDIADRGPYDVCWDCGTVADVEGYCMPGIRAVQPHPQLLIQRLTGRGTLHGQEPKG